MINCNNIFKKLYKSKFDEMNILDLFSVYKDIRKSCLIHCSQEKLNKLKKIVSSLNLNILFERKLLMYKDINSYESVLIEEKKIKLFLKKINKENKISKKVFIKKYFQGKINEILISKKKKKVNLNYIGNFLNYPKCCIKSYEGCSSLNSHYNSYLSKCDVIDWRINRLVAFFGLQFFMPDFFPCNLNCKKAIILGKKYISLAKDIFSKSKFNEIINYQKSPIFIYKKNILLFYKWRLYKKKLIIDSKYYKRIELNKILKPKMNLSSFIFCKKINKIIFKKNRLYKVII